MAAGQVMQPVRAAGGAAAMPLTTVAYAATSLTFQRAALPRRSWQPCATWPWACSPNRTGQCRRAPVPQPRPHRPLATLRIRLERQSPASQGVRRLFAACAINAIGARLRWFGRWPPSTSRTKQGYDLPTLAA